jgi:hypothetical protein
MISLESARALKSAGLQWQPALHDFFAIPERGMDERVFVISDMLATVDVLQGQRVVAFQGASEWALDNLAIGEVTWLPREEQVRTLIESAMLEQGRASTRLDGGLNGYTCTIFVKDESLSFHASQAVEAYALALLHLLNQAATHNHK